MEKEREKVRRLITKGRKEKKRSGEKREDRIIGSEEKLRLGKKIRKENYEQCNRQGKTVKREGNMKEMEP